MFLWNTTSYGFADGISTTLATIGLVFTLFLWHDDSVFKRKMDLVITALILAVLIYDLALRFLEHEKDFLIDEFDKLCKTDLTHDETHIS